MQIFEFSLAGPKGDNQDTVYTRKLSDESILALVADGVGGSEGGKAASMSVLQAAEEVAGASAIDLYLILQNARNHVIALPFPQAATTATAVYLSGSSLDFAHTGDSRLYLLRNSGLRTLTIDQTEVALLISEGVLSPKDASKYRRRNVLTHAIEKGQKLEAQIGSFDLLPGDRLLLLTDGVHKIMQKKEIVSLSQQFHDAKDFGNAIIEAIKHKLIDDASVVVVDI